MPSYNYAFQDNLPPITSSKTDHSEANMVLSKGFGGGKAPILYNHIGLEGPTSYNGSDHYLTFKSQIKIYHQEYTCVLNPGEFNTTSNPTALGYMHPSGSTVGVYFGDRHNSHVLNPDFTASGWTPYATKIGLYREYEKGSVDHIPVIVGSFTKPIKTNRNIPITIKLKFDT